MTDELKIDISMLDLEYPKKWKIELWVKKAKDCLEQLDEKEKELESMEAPRSYECELPKFRRYWKVSKEIDKLYEFMKSSELSNYPLTSRDDLIGFIEYWEIMLKEGRYKI